MRVLPVPSRHTYVQHLGHDEVTGVQLLPDPAMGRDVPAGQWWPPPALEADWVREHRDEFDVLHLHFGFDTRSPAQLQAFVAALRECGKPLVYTVHDLRNPHHPDRGAHDDALDVLVPAADALVTLTRGAADEINRRWDRLAQVLPHPHVVEEPALSAPRPQHPQQDFVVGVHLKSLRACTDPLPVVTALAQTVPDLPGARLRVDVHAEVVTPGLPRYDAGVARALEDGRRAGRFELQVHDLFSDDELYDYLGGLDLSVLPYRFGTHSGWLEACHDLGATVLTSDCGYYAEQRPCLTYHLDETGLDEASLVAGLRRAHAERPGWRADPDDRRKERESLARAHRDIYDQVLTR